MTKLFRPGKTRSTFLLPHRCHTPAEPRFRKHEFTC